MSPESMRSNSKHEIVNATIQSPSIDMRKVPLSAVRQLQLELDRFEEQAKMEMKDPQTRSLGSLRKDLVEVCRRRLTFVAYMIKDAHEHAGGK
jgi:hypothetical protein